MLLLHAYLSCLVVVRLAKVLFHGSLLRAAFSLQVLPCLVVTLSAYDSLLFITLHSFTLLAHGLHGLMDSLGLPQRCLSLN